MLKIYVPWMLLVVVGKKLNGFLILPIQDVGFTQVELSI